MRKLATLVSSGSWTHIDGTRQFVYGMPLFGSLIGVMVDDDPLIGCIDIPMTGERWIGAPRQQAP